MISPRKEKHLPPKMDFDDCKRRKLIPPPRRTKKTAESAEENTPKVIPPQMAESHLKLQQDRNFAVLQAQQDGSTSNFKIIDSQFGNFLIPCVPSRAELAKLVEMGSL